MAAGLVSIVIPTYKTTFLEQAIESALAQTYRPIELVVSDHCPDDGVRELVQRYRQIRYVRNPVPGIYSNFRNCMRLARGEFVKFLLDDDLLQPQCVEKLVRAFEDYPGTTLTSSWYHLIDKRNKVLNLRRLDTDKTLVSSHGGGAVPMLVSARNPIGPLTTCMFRRQSFPLGIGPWFFNTDAPNRYFGLMDMSIILDLAFSGRVVLLAEPLSAMRYHRDALSNPKKNPKAVLSVINWLALAEDAHAFGLMPYVSYVEALESILGQYHRQLKNFPALAEHITGLEQRLAALRAADT